MKTYWNNLTERECLLLGAGGVFFFFCLFYFVLYAPLIESVHEKNQQRIEKQETLLWMKQALTQQKPGHVKERLSPGKGLAILATQLKTSSFHHFPYQLQQSGADDIQLLFDEVPYQAFLTWLALLQERYAFTIKQFNAEQTKTPGVVKLMLIIH
jgi:general secretion pathway protein M